jgi:ribosomal protein L7Ae-like RNA K-turn-binding protein
MDAATQQKILRMLGLGLRGRLIVVGVDRVREAAKSGTLRMAIVAQDASEHSLGKVVPLLEAKQVRMVSIDSAATLGGAVDREATTVIGIVDAQFAKGIRGLVDAAGA